MPHDRSETLVDSCCRFQPFQLNYTRGSFHDPATFARPLLTICCCWHKVVLLATQACSACSTLRCSRNAFMLRSLSRSVWMGTSSTELCQVQPERFARRALVESHSAVRVLQRPRLIVHGDACARACGLHAHPACSLASMQLALCC